MPAHDTTSLRYPNLIWKWKAYSHILHSMLCVCVIGPKEKAPDVSRHGTKIEVWRPSIYGPSIDVKEMKSYLGDAGQQLMTRLGFYLYFYFNLLSLIKVVFGGRDYQSPTERWCRSDSLLGCFVRIYRVKKYKILLSSFKKKFSKMNCGRLYVVMKNNWYAYILKKSKTIVNSCYNFDMNWSRWCLIVPLVDYRV
jgi:hypothetical protein